MNDLLKQYIFIEKEKGKSLCYFCLKQEKQLDLNLNEYMNTFQFGLICKEHWEAKDKSKRHKKMGWLILSTDLYSFIEKRIIKMCGMCKIFLKESVKRKKRKIKIESERAIILKQKETLEDIEFERCVFICYKCWIKKGEQCYLT